MPGVNHFYNLIFLFFFLSQRFHIICLRPRVLFFFFLFWRFNSSESECMNSEMVFLESIRSLYFFVVID